MTHLLPLALSLALARAAVPAQAAEPTVSVEIDVSALPKDDATARLEVSLVERQTQILEDGGFEIVDGAKARIRVTVSRYGDLGIHYRFTVALFDGASATPRAERTLSCELCRESELVTKVGEEVARMSGRLLHEPEQPPEQTPEPQPEQPEGSADEGATQPPEADPVDPPGKRIGVAGYSGIAALPIGVGLVVGGVIALTKEPTVELLPQDKQVERVTTHRRLGAGLTAAGAVVLVSGVVLLVVDQTVLRKRRSKRSAFVLPHPSPAPAGFGVSLTGRF